MFGKRETAKFDPSEFRVHDRSIVHGLKAYIDKELVEILDYSDGGMRVRSSRPLPRVAVIEIFRGDKLVRNTAAVTAWERGGQTGYAFRSKLKLTHIEPVSKRHTPPPPEKNETGGVAGNALRNRLKL